jgi:hypothetical protein
LNNSQGLLFSHPFAMAASPVPVDRGDIQVREKWSGKEDRAGDSLAHGADLPPSNGGPPDERGASDPVNAEYHPRSPGEGDPAPGTRSGGAATIYREKQIKVLRSSHVLPFVPPCIPKSISSLISRDSMLLIAGFPETSYPWLRLHMLYFCSTFTLFSVLDLVFTSVLCSQIRFTSAAYPKTPVKRTFKVVSEK